MAVTPGVCPPPVSSDLKRVKGAVAGPHAGRGGLRLD